MPILDKLRSVIATQQVLSDLKASIIDEAIQAGVTWREMVFIDYNEAIKMLETIGNVPLDTAILIADNFLQANSVKSNEVGIDSRSQ